MGYSPWGRTELGGELKELRMHTHALCKPPLVVFLFFTYQKAAVQYIKDNGPNTWTTRLPEAT